MPETSMMLAKRPIKTAKIPKPIRFAIVASLMSESDVRWSATHLSKPKRKPPTAWKKGTSGNPAGSSAKARMRGQEKRREMKALERWKAKQTKRAGAIAANVTQRTAPDVRITSKGDGGGGGVGSSVLRRKGEAQDVSVGGF